MENRDLTKLVSSFINKKFEKRGFEGHEKLSKQAMEIITQKEPWVKFVDVDPALAEELLSRNFHNRQFKPARLSEFRWNMLHGGFMQTGDTIKFDRLMNLLDGQHRLRSIIDSQTTQRLLIVSGLEPAVFTLVDHHQKRSMADTLSIAGYRNYNMIAGAFNFIFRIMFARLSAGGHDTTTTRMKFYSNYDFLEFGEITGGDAKWHELSNEVVKLAKGFKPAFTGSQYLGLLWILDQVDAKMGRQFIRQICLGVEDFSAPAHLFRQKTQSYFNEQEKRMPSSLMWAYLCKSWEHHFYKKSLGILSMRKGEKRRLELEGIDKVREKFIQFVK